MKKKREKQIPHCTLHIHTHDDVSIGDLFIILFTYELKFYKKKNQQQQPRSSMTTNEQAISPEQKLQP